jgi:7-carboxy-7-deazaguanine synthase
MKKIKWSEIFYSFQGEGLYTGAPTVWLRFFGCNLECQGFGQKEPNKPNTWELPYKTVDISNIKKLEELPVFEYGCDSSYSWASKFKHLAHTNTVSEVVDKLVDIIPKYRFIQNKHHDLGKSIHLAFTGGEPMLWQQSMIDVITEMLDRGNYPYRITVETNGTKIVSDNLHKFIVMLWKEHHIEWFWSISPKLFNVSGEPQGVDIDNISTYISSSPSQLKFVLNNTDAAWKEVDNYVDILELDCRLMCCPIYIMPVGATVESQTGTINSDLAEIANKAISRGWSVAGRLHANIYGNKIGT